MDVIFLAFITTISLLILLFKVLGFERTLRWQKVIDIVATVGLTFLFHGTFSGMAAGIFTGVFLSITLSLLGRAYKTKPLTSKVRDVWFRFLFRSVNG